MEKAALGMQVDVALAALDGLGLQAELLTNHGILYFIYSHDWPARSTPPDSRFRNLADAEKAGKSRDVPRPGSCTSFEGPEFDTIARMARELKSSIALCDVGANYGCESIRYGFFKKMMAEELGTPPWPAVLSFEPGISRHLCVLNLDMHGLHDTLFYARAVSDRSSYAVFHYDPANTLGGGMAQTEAHKLNPRTLLARTVRLDDVLNANSIDLPAFLKIDTQGAEPSVLAGLGNYVTDNIVCALVELSPAVRSIMPEREFVRSLFGRHRVVNVSHRRDVFTELQPADVDDFCRSIFSVAPYFTDLLLIDRRLANFPQR